MGVSYTDQNFPRLNRFVLSLNTIPFQAPTVMCPSISAEIVTFYDLVLHPAKSAYAISLQGQPVALGVSIISNVSPKIAAEDRNLSRSMTSPKCLVFGCIEAFRLPKPVNNRTSQVVMGCRKMSQSRNIPTWNVLLQSRLPL